MGKSESEGASGTINLYREWKESSSSHYEKEKSAKLMVDTPNTLMLVITHSESNMYKIAEAFDNESKYRIGVKQLMELIKEQGEEVK